MSKSLEETLRDKLFKETVHPIQNLGMRKRLKEE